MFEITRSDGGKVYPRIGETVDEVAQRYAQRRKGPNASAVRETGIDPLSGWFRVFMPVPARLGGGMNSTAITFHVTAIPGESTRDRARRLIQRHGKSLTILAEHDRTGGA